MTFIEKLHRLREHHGYSERALAKALDFNQSAISRWKERGSRPRPRLAQKLAALFSVSVHDLLDDSQAIPISAFESYTRAAVELADHLKGDPDKAGQAIFEASLSNRNQSRVMATAADNLRGSARKLRAEAARLEKLASSLERAVRTYRP